MTNRYSLIFVDSHPASWNVYETDSDNVVEVHSSKEEARKRIRFFESGGGFSGFTPAFVCQPTKVPIDVIDEAFSSVFHLQEE